MKKWLDRYQDGRQVVPISDNTSYRKPIVPISKQEMFNKDKKSTIKLNNQIFANNTREKVLENRRNFYFPYETEQTKNIRNLADDQVFKSSGDLISAIHPVGAVINALYQGPDLTLPLELSRFLPSKIGARGYDNFIPGFKIVSKVIDPIQMADKLHTADSLYNSADSIDLYNQFKNGGLVSKNSLNRNVTCSNCGWSWKLSDGGLDPMTCHKCGGDIKMKEGGELDEYKDRGQVQKQVIPNNPYFVTATDAKKRSFQGDVTQSSTGPVKINGKVVGEKIDPYVLEKSMGVAAAIPAAVFAAPSVLSASGVVGAAMNAPLAGVAGLTGSNILNAGFATHGLKSVLSGDVAKPWQQAYESGNGWDYANAAANTVMTGMELFPLLGPAYKGVLGAGNYLTKQASLKNMQKLNPFNKIEGISANLQNTNNFNLEELRKIYHNAKRVLQPQEIRFLSKHGSGLREDYLTDIPRGGWGTDQWNVNNQLPSPPSEIQFMPNGTTRTVYNQQPLVNNTFDLNKLKKPINKSGLTKDEVLAKTSSKDKDAVSKMTETEFENTVLKPNGEIVSYKPGTDIEQMTYDLSNGRMVLKNQTAMTEKEYVDAFNEKLDLLNDIIAKKNKSGVEYKVKGLNENGRLTFHTPEQSIPVKLTDKEKANVEWFNRDPKDWLINKAGLKQEGNKWVLSDGNSNEEFDSIDDVIHAVREGMKTLTEPKTISGESTWGVNINPGQWKGDVEDIANTEYFRSIPGIEMSNTTSGVFADNVARKGTGSYESINEYLKALNLGRVKPGFNSQTEFSRGAWENFIKSGRGVGFYANPRTVYGTMKTLAPYTVPAAIGAGALNQKQQGGPIVTNRGQWDYPGQTTIIPSNNITMQGVPYPVVGVDNTGHTKMMHPGMNYTFPGQYVTEYPMMQGGGQQTTISNYTTNPANWVNPTSFKSENKNNSIYQIKKGDSLSSISNKYNVPLDELIKANNIENPNVILSGQNLVIPNQLNQQIVSKKQNVVYNNNAEMAAIADKRLKYFQSQKSPINKQIQGVQQMPPGYEWKSDISKLKPIPHPHEIERITDKDLLKFVATTGLAASAMVAAPAVLSASGVIGSAMSAPLTIGATTLPYVTPATVIGAGFGLTGANNLANNLQSGYYTNPKISKYDKISTGLTTGLDLLGTPGAVEAIGTHLIAPAYRGVTGILNQPGAKFQNIRNFATESGKAINTTFNDVKNIEKLRREHLNDISTNYDNDVLGLIQDPQKISAENLPTELNYLKGKFIKYFEGKLNSRSISDKFVTNKVFKPLYTEHGGQKKFWDKVYGLGDEKFTESELRDIYKKVSLNAPTKKDASSLVNTQFSKIRNEKFYNPSSDNPLIQDFIKNKGKLVKPEVLPKTEFSADDEKALSAIRALGKFQTISKSKRNSKILLTIPEAVEQLYLHASKIDDDLLKSVLPKISKTEIVNAYEKLKNTGSLTNGTEEIVPKIETTLSENLTQLDPYFRKLALHAHAQDNPSLFSNLVKNYQQSFVPNYNIDLIKSTDELNALIKNTKHEYDIAPNPEFVTNPDKPRHILINEGVKDKNDVLLNPKMQFLEAARKVKDSEKGAKFIGSNSLSTDSYPMFNTMGVSWTKNGLVTPKFSGHMTGLNDMGYSSKNPNLVLKQINSQIEALEKLTGKKFPRGKFVNKGYSVPQIYYEKLKYGGDIMMNNGGDYTFPEQYNTEYSMMENGGLVKYETKGQVQNTNKKVTIDNRNMLEKFFNFSEDEVKNFNLPEDVYTAYETNKKANVDKKWGIASKKNVRAYFFNPDGSLAVEDEVGFGQDRGEQQPIYYQVKTTPSGTYRIERAKDAAPIADKRKKGYASNNFFYMDNLDPNKKLIVNSNYTGKVAPRQAIHGIPTHLLQERSKYFNNNDVNDNYMSAGCINCKRQFLDNPYFNSFQDGLLYVLPEKQRGGEMIKRADGSYSKRGLWDNIRDNRGSGKAPTKQMLDQERKIRNQYQEGGEQDRYWRTKQPMVNDPSMDAISKVLLYRNQDKNFMQRAAGFGYQGGIPSRYIPGEDPNSNNMSSLLMSSGDNQVFPTIIQTAPSQLSYQPYQSQEYIEAPTEDIADYFAAKGYKRAANDMYGMEYKNGGYVVRRSHDRKGKTHVVTGPDGTKKYFGDPNMGERGKSKYGKEAFYARHKSNLAKNPYFRAYARATWKEGGETMAIGGQTMMNPVTRKDNRNWLEFLKN